MQRATWTDERLDELSRHVDVRFDQVDKRFERVDQRFERVENEIRSIRTDLRRDMGALQVDLKSDVRDLRVDLKSDIVAVSTEVAEIRRSIERLGITLTRGLVAVIVCLAGILAASAIA